MNRTAQQEAAVTTEGRALLVEAGAGTGKTAVLVERFLHLLDVHRDWPIESIVAVTFTEKATREMRSRIREGVEREAAEAGPFSHWQERRRDLDRLAVSTIHGLCARILRENPIAAGIDPRFTVLEEQDTALLREQAVRQALGELAAGAKAPGADAYDPFDLLASFETRDLQEQMLLLLGKRGTVSRLFEQLPERELLLAQWRAGVAEMQRELWQEHLRQHEEAAEALEGLAGLIITNPADKLAEHVRSAQEGCACAAVDDLPGAAARFAGIKLNVGSAGSWGGSEGLKEVKGWLKAVRTLGECLSDKGCDQPVGPDDERAAEALQCWRVLWNYVGRMYDTLKAERRALDFDDLERLAWQLLTAQTGAGATRDERVQATIDDINHLMVDEFQDVNEVQGEILTSLADLSAGGKFFAVGDAKQSIYRFRQAQVKVFNGTAREILRQTGCEPLPLSRSFRTEASLLRALNAAFDAILAPLGSRHTDFEAQPGPLEAARPTLASDEAARGRVEVLVLPPALADAGRRIEAGILARRLNELVAARFQVWDRKAHQLRSIRYDDIAILFRATTSLPIYEEVFKAHGLPYLTLSGRGYYDRPEVRDLTALLAYLYNPADDLSAATVLRSPMFSLSDETLYRLRWLGTDGAPAESPIPFTQALSAAIGAPPDCTEPDRVRAAAETLAALRKATGRVDVWTLLRRSLDQTGYEATLALADLSASARTARGGGRGRANVAKFLQLARERGGADLSSFLQSVQDLREREAREGEALPDSPDSGAVQLMSVHAAKGLEFPVVVLADLGRGQRNNGASEVIRHDPLFGLACAVRDQNGKWLKPAGYRWAEWLDGRMEEAERKRLLYVACTRAADLLILSGGLKAQDSWLRALAKAWELELDSQVETEEDGAREKLVEGSGYTIRLVWPAAPDEEEMPRGEPHSRSFETGEMLTAIPPLAQPLPVQRAAWPIAVTHLPDVQADEEDELPPLRPVVVVDEAGARGRRPWRFLVGNLAHRALADWDCIGGPADPLEDRLIRWARRGGLFETQDVHEAVSRVSRMLTRLRSTVLYREVCAASARHAEVPLSIGVGSQMLHGVLDLLYCDRMGQWRLLDWKTEPVRKGETLEEAARPYLRQMAVYRHAVQQLLGYDAQVEICFLSHGAEVYRLPAELLTQEWNRLLEAA